MIRIRGYEVVDSWNGVEAWRLGWTRVPLERVREGLVSIEPNTRLARRRRRHRRQLDPPAPVDHALFQIATPSGRRRFEGLLIGSDVAALADYLLRRCEPAPGTDLYAWCRVRGIERPTRKALATGLADLIFALSGHEDPPESALAGIWVRRAAPDDDLAVHRGPRGTWWFQKTAGPVRVAATRRLVVSGRQVPVEVFAGLSEDEDLRMGWWDGVRFGFAGDWDEVPATLRAELGARGTACPSVERFQRPLTDLRPVFLVRQPTRAEARRTEVGPAPFAGAALLLPSDSPVGLLDPLGAPIDLPVYDAPAAALGLLCRAGLPPRCYVPGMASLAPADLDLDARPAWHVGLLPFGGVA